jgi:alanyl-tRNA synthetase
MTNTIRLFDSDAYRDTFRARVLEEKKVGDRFAVVLDRTLFYPESGGQPCDTGILDGQQVDTVSEEGETILHFLNGRPKVGEEIEGKIDWVRRFDHMQQHSGQHILSQSFLQVADAHTRGFHLGKEFSTLDLNCPVTPEDVEAVELLANQIVTENRPVVVHKVLREDLNRYQVRRDVAAEGEIRLVEIEGFECTGCCGTHVRQTGDIGLIKVLKNERYKGGTRIYFVCGSRALADYQFKHTLIDDVCRNLSISETDLRAKLEKMESEHRQLVRDLKVVTQELTRLESKQITQNAEKVGSNRLIVHCFENRDMGSVLTMLKQLIREQSTLVLFGIEGKAPALIFGRSDDMDLDLNPFFKHAIEAIEGRGGGSPSLIQGRGRKSGEVSRILEEVRHRIEDTLSAGI